MLDTVRFINFHQDETKEPNELSIKWVLVAIYHGNDIRAALMQILSDADFLMMYCIEDSYLWQCKK